MSIALRFGLVLLVLMTLAQVQLCLNGAHLSREIMKEKLNAEANGGKLWVFLCAGSDGYDNYRHQADVYHAYQIIAKNHGLANTTILMAYDDIANAFGNKHKGVIINEPNGPNVYPGEAAHDYRREQVSRDNFLAVLTGDKSGVKGGSGRVLETDENDTIFVYFADHGGPGVIAFPQKFLVYQPLLSAEKVMAALKEMHAGNKYTRFTFFIEACFSGTMFDQLLDPSLNIYGMTAADPFESSYACDYSKEFGTYLNDCWSIHWMDEVTANAQEDLTELYSEVVSDTNTSHPCVYGDLALGNDSISVFIGADSSSSSVPPKKMGKRSHGADAVSAHEVDRAILLRRLAHAESAEEKKLLSMELRKERLNRLAVEDKVNLILHKFTRDAALREELMHPSDYISSPGKCHRSSSDLAPRDCELAAMDAFAEHCGLTSNYAYKHLTTMSNLCKRFQPSPATVTEAIRRSCFEATRW